MPNGCWQSDSTHYRLTGPDGTPVAEVEIISWLDDCTRYALPSPAESTESSPSTPPRTTNPKMTKTRTHIRGFGPRRCPETSHRSG